MLYKLETLSDETTVQIGGLDTVSFQTLTEALDYIKKVEK